MLPHEMHAMHHGSALHSTSGVECVGHYPSSFELAQHLQNQDHRAVMKMTSVGNLRPMTQEEYKCFVATMLANPAGMSRILNTYPGFYASVQSRWNQVQAEVARRQTQRSRERKRQAARKSGRSYGAMPVAAGGLMPGGVPSGVPANGMDPEREAFKKVKRAYTFARAEYKRRKQKYNTRPTDSNAEALKVATATYAAAEKVYRDMLRARKQSRRR